MIIMKSNFRIPVCANSRCRPDIRIHFRRTKNYFSPRENFHSPRENFLSSRETLMKRNKNRQTFANLWNSEKTAKGSEKNSPFLIYANILRKWNNKIRQFVNLRKNSENESIKSQIIRRSKIWRNNYESHKNFVKFSQTMNHCDYLTKKFTNSPKFSQAKGKTIACEKISYRVLAN